MRTTGADAGALRHKLKLTQADFARLVGVDTRTVNRWEKGGSPTGSPAGVILGLRRKLEHDPWALKRMQGIARRSVELGSGLPSLLLTLLDLALLKRKA